ncbi:single-stranded DNA-binding protein [Corynebacterium sp.]|uniref:single-stranded DNA-binding protein n=1 Tax=Corynebacterium sp. TaxID=1720 RepID=UPI003B3A37A9
MAGETPITVVGRLVADPELRYTPSGTAVANFRVAQNPRVYNSQTNQWEDGDTSFYACNVWRAKAEAVAQQLQKGALVIVQGSIAQRFWANQQGEKRSAFEVKVENVGPAILPPRTGQGGQSQQQSSGWSQPQGSAPQSSGFSGGDEPPF